MRIRLVASIYTLLTVLTVFFLGGCTTFPFHDEFTDPSNLSEYRVFDERQVDSYQIVNGQLKITASENQDLWGGPTGGGPLKRGAPLLLIDAPAGLYTAEALVTATNIGSPGGPQALNTQVGLFVFRDIDNWMFYGFTNHDFTIGGTRTQGDGLIATVTHNGSSLIHHQWPNAPGIDSAFLRLKKYKTPSGDFFELKYRASASDPWIVFANTIHFSPHHGTEEVGMGVKTFDLAGAGVSNLGLGIFDEFLVDTY